MHLAPSPSSLIRHWIFGSSGPSPTSAVSPVPVPGPGRIFPARPLPVLPDGSWKYASKSFHSHLHNLYARFRIPRIIHPGIHKIVGKVNIPAYIQQLPRFSNEILRDSRNGITFVNGEPNQVLQRFILRQNRNIGSMRRRDDLQLISDHLLCQEGTHGMRHRIVHMKHIKAGAFWLPEPSLSLATNHMAGIGTHSSRLLQLHDKNILWKVPNRNGML